MKRLALLGLAVLLAGCSKGAAPTGRTVDQLRQALKGPSAQARGEAAAALGELGPQARPAVGDLAEALKDRDEQVRVKAAAALWGIGRDAREAWSALLEALKDRSAAVRLNAVGALGEVGGGKEAVPALAPALK